MHALSQKDDERDRQVNVDEPAEREPPGPFAKEAQGDVRQQGKQQEYGQGEW